MASRKMDPGGYSLGKDRSLEVAARVSGLMQEKGLTQAALAQEIQRADKHTKLQQPHISALLKGGRRFQRWQVLVIAKALGCTEQHLVPDARTAPSPLDRHPLPEPTAPPKPSQPGLADYLENHHHELRPVIVDALKKTTVIPETWEVDDTEEIWEGVVEVLEKAYRKHKDAERQHKDPGIKTART